MNWNSSQFHISNSLLKKIQICLRFRSVYKQFSVLNYFKIFETRIACFRIWNFSETDFVWLSLNHLECFIVWNACRQKLKLLANRCKIWNELNWFKFQNSRSLLKERKVISNRFSLENEVKYWKFYWSNSLLKN